MSDPMTPDEFLLKHYGVKGMKWGVVNEDEPKGRKKGQGDNVKTNKPSKAQSRKEKKASDAELVKKYMEASSKPAGKSPSQKQQIASQAENHKKFLAKAEATPEYAFEQKTGFHPSKKQIAYTVAGAAAAGLLIYGAYKVNQNGGLKTLNPFYAEPGKPVSSNVFQFKVQMSKLRSWGDGLNNGYIQKSSYLQEEFTLPKGHVFHRISTLAEDSFKDATYSTHSVEDYHRYLSSFRQELGPSSKLHHVTFKATEDIKVPNLVTRLEAMKQVLHDSGLLNPTEHEVLREYQALSGGTWNSSHAKSFFKILSEKGYSAIVDDMDAGVIGESPLVLFRKDAFTSKVSSVISQADIDLAESSLIEIMNRK